MTEKNWLDQLVTLDEIYGDEKDNPYWLIHPISWLKSKLTRYVAAAIAEDAGD